MPQRTSRFTLDQVGTGIVRFPSGAPIPHLSDAMVDPYVATRISKDYHVEGVMFWPQSTETFPGLILLHENWGLNEQIKNAANRLAAEGFVVIVPNLYGRLGGMVTANTEVAEALMEQLNEKDTLQDINSCCEYLNTRDHVKRNIHGVIGYGMGGGWAILFAGQRKRLRAAVSFYGQIPSSMDTLKSQYCPLLYHHAALDANTLSEDLTRIEESISHHGKKVAIQSYPDTLPAFCNENRPDSYNPVATEQAWEATVDFFDTCFKGL